MPCESLRPCWVDTACEKQKNRQLVAILLTGYDMGDIMEPDGGSGRCFNSEAYSTQNRYCERFKEAEHDQDQDPSRR